MDRKENDIRDMRDEKVIRQLWEDSEGKVSPETMKDLEAVHRMMDASEGRKKAGRRIWLAAASIALAVLSSVLTWTIADRPEPEYAQVSTEYGERTSITLADGTSVTLNAGSSIVFPEQFTGDTRTVFLIGEANFDVAEDDSKRFIVKTRHMGITVVGTKFCVEAYPDESVSRTTLIDGRVKVEVTADSCRSYILDPDMQLAYDAATRKTEIREVNAGKIASWEQGYLVFSGVDFGSIASAIERKFGVEIYYDAAQTGSRQEYFAKFRPDETLEETLDVLTMLIDGSSYRMDGKNIFFYF